MIRQYTFKITPLDKNERIHFNMGSVMHGRLMESLPSEAVEKLHDSSVRPYSQYLQAKDNSEYWQINALTQGMDNYVQQLVQAWDNNIIYLKQRDKRYHMQLYSTSSKYSYQNFSRYFFTKAQPQRNLHMKFITPTSFKTDNQYQLFPDIKLILTSIYRRWNALSDSIIFEDEQACQDICNSTFINSYHLSSKRFGLEKIRINGFSGNIDIGIKGPEMTVRWINLLLAYAQFCGIGIKTALGMGAVEVYSKIREEDKVRFSSLLNKGALL